MSAALALTNPSRGLPPEGREDPVEGHDDLAHAFDAAMAPHLSPEAAPDAQILAFPASRTAAAPTMRTFRRRRLIVLLGVMLAILMGAAALGLGGAGATGPTPISQTVTVEPGQSLWDVAADVAPAGADTRAVMLELAEFNGVTPGSVPAWTVLVIPDTLG